MPHTEEQMGHLRKVSADALASALRSHAQFPGDWRGSQWDQMIRDCRLRAGTLQAVPGAGGEAAAFPVTIHLMGGTKVLHSTASRILLAFECCWAESMGKVPTHGMETAADPEWIDRHFPLRFLADAQLREAQAGWVSKEHSDTFSEGVRVPRCAPQELVVHFSASRVGVPAQRLLPCGRSRCL